ncbi:MAG: glycosyltransferase family 4 protein, partial [Bacteroidota bacterium]
GLQNKLLEALAMGLPSVTTPISAIPLAPGYENHVKVGKTAEELASYVFQLLNDYQSDIFKETGPWEYIAEHYDTEKIGIDLESLLVSATSKKIN